MAATKNSIRYWLERAKKEGATHVIIVCDTFDWEDYQVYVTSDQDVREIEKRYSGQNMQRVMEVYSLNYDIEKQLNEYRTFHYD